MSLFDLVKENEELIHSFQIEKEIEKKEYQILSALNTLDNTNEIGEYYSLSLDEGNVSLGEKLFRIYGILQSLFVSIDSLYILAYAYTNSKSYININQNPALRELKYLRNDVVGHPTNRVYENDELGYCILMKENILDESNFSYSIFIDGNETKHAVNLNDCLTNFYIESNSVLKRLHDYLNSSSDLLDMREIADRLYDSFYNNSNYKEVLSEIKSIFIKNNIKSTTEHRALWRFEVMDALDNFKASNSNEEELQKFALAFEINKICEIINPLVKGLTIKYKLPKYVSSFFRFLHQNTRLDSLINYLYDMTHPLFVSSVNKIMVLSKAASAFYVYDYMKLLLSLAENKQGNLVYAFGILTKKYNKK